LGPLNEHGAVLEFDGSLSSGIKIRSFADIPDIIGMKVPPVEYIVPALGIARNTITLWTVADGDGKTYLALAMAIAVSRGDAFLGMTCLQCPVLYLDLENPAYVVQDRLHPMTSEESIPKLRIWGIWNEQQPPQYGSELLLTIAKETQPLIIIDPFRYFHNAKENDSDEMSAVMQYLRACARYGGAVVVMHHPSKTEGSTGRGSTAIRGACDLAFLHSLDRESSNITIKVDKNRNGESRTITLRADFEEGRFEVTEAPYITRRNDELSKIEGIITGQPGITQNGIAKTSGIRRNRLPRLLNEGATGKRWHIQSGPSRSKLFYPGPVVSIAPEPRGITDTSVESGGEVVSVVRRSLDRTTIPPTDHGTNGKSLTQCQACKSFAVYPEKDGRVTCMTCDAVVIH
jgi:hypothetical protein